MNLREALEELSQKYPDRYVSVSYTVDRYFWKGKYRDSVVCSVFRGAGNDPMGQIGKGRTWKEALENLDPPDLSVQDEPCDDTDLLDHERREDAVQTAAEVRRERREGKG